MAGGRAAEKLMALGARAGTDCVVLSGRLGDGVLARADAMAGTLPPRRAGRTAFNGELPSSKPWHAMQGVSDPFKPAITAVNSNTPRMKHEGR